ncbi:MAG: futalosine hydrolase, partial [Thermodesulfovibrionales bacterium]
MEAGLLLDCMTGKEEVLVQGKSFFTGRLSGRAFVLSICGVGKTNAAHGTTLLIERFRPSQIISIGVAGAYPSSGLEIGDIALAEQEVHGDEGLLLGESFRGMDALGLPLVRVEGKEFYNRFPLSIPPALEAVRKGVFITVSSCTGTIKRGKEMEELFQGICENMEGAAVAQICTLSGIPCTEIRGISNLIEDRDGSPLNKKDLILASEKVQEFLLRLIEGHHIFPP